MDMPALGTKEDLNQAAQDGPFPSLNQQQGRKVDIQTYNLHEILAGNAPIDIDDLQYLIQCQATLHLTTAQKDKEKLKNLLKSKGSSIRGFALCTNLGAPVAYAIYYPMIDRNGGRVAYCEDFFIVESYRGKGVAKILFHELAKRTMTDGAEYLLWATDKRNTPVHGFVQNKLGAKQNNIVTLDTSELLNEKLSLKHHWDSVAFETRPIKQNDVDLLNHNNFNPKIIRQTGDVDFKGMLTFDKNDGRLRAVTPGWIHTTTFQLRRGLHLEHPTFIGGEINSQDYVASVAIASEKISTKRSDNLGYMRWHVANDSELKSHLKDDLGFKVDSMLGTPESELIVYQLSNGALKSLAQNEPSRSICIVPSAPIGLAPAHV